MFLQAKGKKEEFYELQLIQNLFLDQSKFSVLFANCFDSFKVLEIVACLGPPKIWKPTYYHPRYELTQWTAKSIQMKLFNSPFHPTQSFYLKYIELLCNDNETSHYYETLIAFLPFDFSLILSTDSVVSKNRNIERFFNSLIFLYKDNNALFISLKPTINSQLHSITSKILFETFGFNVLKIYTGITPSEIQYFPFEKVNSKNIHKVINYLLLLDNQKVVDILQRLISFYETTKYLAHFNHSSILFQQDINFVLLNESLSNQKTFIDISLEKISYELNCKVISNIFIKDNTSNNENNYYLNNNNSYINTKFLPISFPDIESMLSSFFLASYDKYLDKNYQLLISYSSDLLKLEKQLNIESESSFHHTMIELFERISNDYYLITFVGQTLGIKKSVDDLLTQSIPFQLKPILDHHLDISLINKKYFDLSDNDIALDCDFIRCYEIISKTIQFITNKEMAVFEDKDDLIDKLRMISNETLKSNLTIDLFSLIFLNHKNEANQITYYCDLLKLTDILDLISDYFPEYSIFNAASEHITLASFQGSTNLEQAFVTKSQMIDTFIKKNEFDLAESLAYGNERFTYLVHLYKRINQIEIDQKNDSQDTIQDQNVLNNDDINDEGIYLIEEYCSKGITSHFISFFKHENLLQNSEMKLIFNTKFNSQNVFKAYNDINKGLTKVQTVPKCNFVDEYEEYQSFIDSAKSFYGIETLISVQNLIKSHNEYENVLSLFKSDISDNSSSAHYTSFNEYMKIYAEYQKNSNQSIETQLTPDKIIDMIDNSSSQVANYKSLTTLLGQYAIELIFLYKRNISYRLIDIIGDISPVSQLAALYQKACSNDFDSKKFGLYFHWPFTPFDKYMKQKLHFSDDLNDSDDEIIINNDAEIIIQNIEDNLIEISDDNFTLIFDISMKKKDYNKLNYLFYKSPAKFKEFVLANISKFTLEDLYEIYPFCGYKSLKFISYIFQDKSVIYTDILDFDKIVLYLLKTKKYSNILFLNDEFPFVIQIAKKVIEKQFDLYKDIPIDYLKKFELDNQFLNQLVDDTNHFDILKKRIESTNKTVKDLIEEIENANVSIQSLQINEMHYLIHIVINQFINPIIIDSNTNEVYLSKQFYHLSEIFKNVEIFQFEMKLQAIANFISREMQSHFGISYNLDGFNTDAFGEKMAGFCIQYDYHQEMLEICKAWSIDISCFVLSRSLTCFKLNLLDIGLSFISYYKNDFSMSNIFNKNGKTTINQKQIKNELINVLSNHILFDLLNASKSENEISTFHILKDSMIPMHLRINQIMEKSESIIASSPQINCLHQLFSMMNDYEELIEFYVAMNDFKCALNVFNVNIIQSNNSYSFQRDVFIKYLVCAAISTNGWNTFLFKIKKNKDLYKQFIEDMFKYFQAQNMYFLAYSIQEKLGYFELAYKSSIHLYLNDYLSFDDRENCINSIIRPILYKLLNINSNSKYFLNELEKVNLMSNINQNFILNKISFNKDYEIFTSKENAIAVGILTIDYGLLDLTMQMIQLKYFSIDEICRFYLDSLFKENQNVETKLKAFCQNIQAIDNELCEPFIMTFFFILDQIVSNKNWLKAFIDSNVKIELKGQLFIQCGFIEEAFLIAKKTHDVHLMTIIKDDAKGNKKDDIYKQSLEILQKWK